MRGFSLIEAMIALALGTAIILGVTTTFTDSSRALNDISRAGRQIETGLYAMDLLARELVLVDYWGEASAPVDADDPLYGPLREAEVSGLEVGLAPAVPALCVGTGATGDDPRVELAWAMEYPLLAGLGSELNNAVSMDQCKLDASTASADSAFAAIRRASTCATGSDGIAEMNHCDVPEDFFYLQTNGCYDDNAGLSGGEIKLYRTTEAEMSTTLNYMRYGCDAGQSEANGGFAPIYRYVSRIYYVSQTDRLVRLALRKNRNGELGYQQEIMAEGIETLQFEWFIDDTGDGEYDRVLSALSHEDASNVVGAKIWLVVRDLNPRPTHADEAVYTVAGKPWRAPEGKGAYSRTVHSRVVALPNRVGRRR